MSKSVPIKISSTHSCAPAQTSDRKGTGRVPASEASGSDYTPALAAKLLARLDGVRPAGAGRWYARCPAHDDRSPSLSIRETDDKVLINCFAGCAADDVLTAVDMSWRDLYPDRWDCARLRPNEAATRYSKRTLATVDPMQHERAILRAVLALADEGKVISMEDEARVAVALERIKDEQGGRRGKP